MLMIGPRLEGPAIRQFGRRALYHSAMPALTSTYHSPAAWSGVLLLSLYPRPPPRLDGCACWRRNHPPRFNCPLADRFKNHCLSPGPADENRLRGCARFGLVPLPGRNAPARDAFLKPHHRLQSAGATWGNLSGRTSWRVSRRSVQLASPPRRSALHCRSRWWNRGRISLGRRQSSRP